MLIFLGLLLILLPAFTEGKVDNPCDDAPYLLLKQKDLRDWSDQEFGYFMAQESACLDGKEVKEIKAIAEVKPVRKIETLAPEAEDEAIVQETESEPKPKKSGIEIMGLGVIIVVLSALVVNIFH